MIPVSGLAEEFMRALPADALPASCPLDALQTELQRIVTTAQARWPMLDVSLAGFVRHLASTMQRSDDVMDVLRTVHADDIYLAYGCAVGDSRALIQFEEAYFGEIRAIAARTRTTQSRDELAQVVREKLFVAHMPDPPRIVQYAGRGDLRNWFRVAVLRTTLNWAKRGPRESATEEQALCELIASGADVEWEYLKAAYRHVFRSALAYAIQTLPVRERNALRFSLLDGLSIDDIAAMHGVHRATAARWIQLAKDHLAASVRASLMRELHADRAELESILRLIRSQIDITIERVLETTNKGKPEGTE